MKPLYPNGEMPIVQLSVKQDLDPLAHLSVGRMLAPLRDEGVIIIGSGSSFHNLGLRGPLRSSHPAVSTTGCSRRCSRVRQLNGANASSPGRLHRTRASHTPARII
jgi:hypothetical protein